MTLSKQDLTPHEYQDKFKQMADHFTLMSSNSPEVNNAAGVAASALNNKKASKPVSSGEPVCGVCLQDAAEVTFISPSQVTTVQPETRQAETVEVNGLTPANLLNQMSRHSSMQVDLPTGKSPPNEQYSPPIREGTGVHMQLSQESQFVHTSVGGGIFF